MLGLTLIRQTASWLTARLRLSSERGASAVEYGIVAGLIAAVIVIAVVFLGNRTSASFSCAASNIDVGTKATGC